MADEKPSGGLDSFEAIGLLVLLAVVGSYLAGQALKLQRVFDQRFAVGSEVVITAPTRLRESPAGLEIAAIPEGLRGIIQGGPEEAGGAPWWNIRIGGRDGWVEEAVLTAVGGPETFRGILEKLWTWYKYVATFVSLAIIVAIAYVVMRVNAIVASQKRLAPARAAHAGVVSPEQRKWERVAAHVESENQADWRLAILEADVMLEEMIEGMGYRGESLGEIMKGIEKSDFTTIDKAWEAHKVRNQIAHEGGDFELNQREARRVIALFKEVFEEFKYI